jgi:hypothetical protein
MLKQKKKTKKSKWANDLLKLTPGFYSLAIATIAMGIASDRLGKSFAEEIIIRMLEFKKMMAIEVEKNDKNSKIIEYHKLKGIKNYIKNFLKRNSKWKAEDEDYCGVKTGRIILTRVYRTYHKKRYEDDNCCSECGRSYDD